jgi:hypothetical protein
VCGNADGFAAADFVDVEMWYLSPVLLVAGGVTFLVLIAGLLWFYTTKGVRNSIPNLSSLPVCGMSGAGSIVYLAIFNAPQARLLQQAMLGRLNI